GFPCDDPKKFSRLSDRKITSDQVCLHLLFDVTPPHPSTTFVFLLEGLEKRGSSLRGRESNLFRGRVGKQAAM
ncbi:MAG TPA: hypothetical protein VFR18_01350, partial [Terriglobia bacterium]|nr:hypothetical protein [Terriglobia bacterium]